MGRKVLVGGGEVLVGKSVGEGVNVEVAGLVGEGVFTIGRVGLAVGRGSVGVGVAVGVSVGMAVGVPPSSGLEKEYLTTTRGKKVVL